MTKHCTKPCPGCPFNRSIEPGALGGSPVSVYIGQAHGPYVLACHAAKGYAVGSVTPESVQCGGAAIFRANVGVTLPPVLHALPPDTVSVFANEAEFIAHHEGMSVNQARRLLAIYTPEQMRDEQMRRSTNRYFTREQA